MEIKKKNKLDDFYQTLLEYNIRIHPNEKLDSKPWAKGIFYTRPKNQPIDVWLEYLIKQKSKPPKHVLLLTPVCCPHIN